ncbi:MAG: excalibur calcium-binding domain-containing protein [Propionicimonas sp.]|nr:excalibur calcium-binding domain-containing protein [Propionicimonas sp.]
MIRARLLAGAVVVALTAAIGPVVGVTATPVAATAVAVAVPSGQTTTEVVTLAAKKFKNCTALNKKYRHGVGKKSARDKVRGSTRPVTNFKRDNALYRRNSHLDRDKDGVACEKR